MRPGSFLLPRVVRRARFPRRVSLKKRVEKSHRGRKVNGRRVEDRDKTVAHTSKVLLLVSTSVFSEKRSLEELCEPKEYSASGCQSPPRFVQASSAASDDDAKLDVGKTIEDEVYFVLSFEGLSPRVCPFSGKAYTPWSRT